MIIRDTILALLTVKILILNTNVDYILNNTTYYKFNLNKITKKQLIIKNRKGTQ